MSKPHRLLSDLAAIERQLNQLFENPLRNEEQMRAAWSPAVDIYETPTQFVLTAEVPGVNSSEIDIKVVDHNLILRGERRWERDAQSQTELFHRLESSYGKFERTFNLSERIDVGNISAEISRGVLTVVLPKREPKARKIKVETKDE
ncbi:MAG TPA: Hsp20/alpha crystallin family protein [Blastocatellia bacterium]|nr:Hsp20/alpha crystallin family protein [Blastocatellia bacterium]